MPEDLFTFSNKASENKIDILYFSQVNKHVSDNEEK